MSTPLPTHEVVAVFPAEIKAGVVSLRVRMHGSMQVLVGSEAVMEGVVAALVERGIRAPVIATTAPIPDMRGQRGRQASREYWRRMRVLRVEYDHSPRATGNLRVLADKHGISYGSTFSAFKQIRDGIAPFPDEEPAAPRTPILKPGRKTIL